MKILVFLQGTILMHSHAAGLSREEIIKEVQAQEESVRDFANYIPIGNAPQKLQKWAVQGADICYLSALTENKKARGDELVGREGLKADEVILQRYGFPHGIVYHRDSGETYQDVVEKIAPLPNVLIEDDCESIGGESEMTYPHLGPGVRARIKSIVVKEFEGIDRLPDDIKFLRVRE